MAHRPQGPKFLHQLRTSALPPTHLRSSAEKLSRLVKPSSKLATPTCPLRSSPRKHSKTQTSTNQSAHPPQRIMQPSITPSPSSSPHMIRSSQVSPPPSQMRTLRSTSNQHKSTPPTHEELSEASQVECSPALEEDNTGAAHKKRRGETRGLELTKKKRSGHLIDIDIPEHVRRAVGVNCQSYITNIGCIVRQNAPLQVKSWNEIERTDVAYLLRRVREKFKLGNEPHVDEAIEEDMKRRYTTWRYNLHKKFLQYESVEEALENRPENVGEDDWNYLINWWQDDEFLDLSEKNKKNRDKLTVTHCAGTKAFSRIRYENQNPETGEEPSRIDMFKLTRFSKKKTSWVGDVAENAFDEMTKLKNPSQTNEESVEAMSDDEIYDKVISTIVGPPRSGYIRGLGAGPKPKKSKVAANSHSQVQEARRRADEAERRSAQLADELEAVKASAAQQNEELEVVKASAAQQSEELKAVKAKQNETDSLLKKLMAQLTSRK